MFRVRKLANLCVSDPRDQLIRHVQLTGFCAGVSF